jgi:hypothetical protein
MSGTQARLDAIRAHVCEARRMRTQWTDRELILTENAELLLAELERVTAALRNRDHVIDLFQAAIRAHPRWCGYREALTVVEPCDHQPEWITDGVCQACFAALAGGARAAQEDK